MISGVLKRIGYGPVVTLDDWIPAKPSAHDSIPNVIIQTWEEKSFSALHALQILIFRARNSGLHHRLFDAFERDTYMETRWSDHKILSVYRASRFGALRADIFRYCIIWDLGGYYFDISKGLRGSVVDIKSKNSTGLITFENNPYPSLKSAESKGLLFHDKLVCQWGFGFSARHPLLGMHIEEICNRASIFADKVFENPKAAILGFTGPLAFTETVHRYSLLQGMDGISQAGIDFNGRGIYSMLGSGFRHRRFPSYALRKGEKILDRI